MEFLEELDCPDDLDNFDEWSDEVDMFMEVLSNPYKLEELWQQSKAKKLWDNFQATRLHFEKKNPRLARSGISSSEDNKPGDTISITDYMR